MIAPSFFCQSVFEHLLNVCYRLCDITSCWIVAVCFYYFIRVNYLNKAGMDWHARIQQLPGFDEDDYVFLRPTQSESVMLQFGDLLLVRKGDIIDHWPVFSLGS